MIPVRRRPIISGPLHAKGVTHEAKRGSFETVGYYAYRGVIQKAVDFWYKKIGNDLGFKYVASAPLVRSSYHADAVFGDH